MQKFYSASEQDTIQIAKDFASQLKGGEVIAFIGGLGMGKTAFVRGALLGLNNDSRVSSPTFALVNDYGGTPNIYHFDMYRVTDADDLYSTGYFDYLRDDSVLFIEWSENVKEFLPKGTIYISFSKTDNENERWIQIDTEEQK